MSSPFPHLFDPLALGDLHLPNRIVLAPLTRSRALPGEVAGALTARYYAQRASGGLLISEGTQISPSGRGYPRTPGIHSPEQIAGWKGVTEAVHAAGGRIFAQLWHVGRISHRSLQPGGVLPVAPSAIRPKTKIFTESGLVALETPRALDTAEMADIVASFRAAAENARAAGFDGVEIHAANGYLLDQFLRDGTNHRDDAYGGSIDNRLRLVLEVVEAVLGVWDKARVGLRLSPANPFNDILDSTPQATFEAVVSALDGFGLGYLHMVEGSLGSGEGAPEIDFAALRRLWQGVYMANGGYDGPRAEAALASGHAQLVSFGTAYLANPDLPERLRTNAPLNTPDSTTFYQGEDKGYVDYPTLADGAA
ncbi:alkene reductase [Rhodospirillum rubrum]|uniref:NADH:flavin oxidoreductase/NADH oxidase n=1 Tax=Rhodospirillum rubrum (strain ATCC 11170 / ATH 1.1.1 / DSM 467 / LMG 4362 / NCIMB 8255 / S1) TaxID=269796 RepID=Q2RX65_RHORT|nr:alkene reductase [Rhodospirillum rubrum]ABC21280.1 NADH:flavin oxidoreductase/NADH oxidase [Rhodospirillum rubrum ATCC 11170]AEO46958.1 NADH:flavin oxidoreductase/NADH oxidase [Rhodospirillum rubrum F11]MBK5952834.1 alkene reductase [Rhodospirillum rubrum]QXG80965.1 alkene reductase [Rhodospirillum rubrum]